MSIIIRHIHGATNKIFRYQKRTIGQNKTRTSLRRIGLAAHPDGWLELGDDVEDQSTLGVVLAVVVGDARITNVTGKVLTERHLGTDLGTGRAQ